MQYVLDRPGTVAGQSISQLANACETSSSTVTRLANLLGYSGYPALRTAIAMQEGRTIEAGWSKSIGATIGRTDTPDVVVATLGRAHNDGARSAVSALDAEALAGLAARIAHAARIVIYAEWGDLPTASELYMRLLRIGLPVGLYKSPLELQRVVQHLRPGTVALAADRAGSNEMTARFLRSAGERGATTALVTSSSDADLLASAEVVITPGTPNAHTWTEIYAGRAGDAIAFGALWLMVAQRVPGSTLDMDVEWGRMTEHDPSPPHA